MTNLEKGLHSYPKVYNLGHRAIRDLFEGPVVVQEKLDGSQFSFGVSGGELFMRSKGARIDSAESAPNLFTPAAMTAEMLFAEGQLAEGYTYRGEALHRPKHNVLEYARAPGAGLVLFDVDVGLEDRVADPAVLAYIAGMLGLEVVPTVFTGEITNLQELQEYLTVESMLGGVPMEGVVIKNYARFGVDGKMLMGKLVRESFKEQHSKQWGKEKAPHKDVLGQITARYRTEARWQKAIQRLQETDALTDSPKDIGPLLKSVVEDVEAECREEIAQALFAAFWPRMRKGLTLGLPEWYKARLAEQQFAGGAEG